MTLTADPPLIQTRFTPGEERSLTDRLCEVVASRRAAGIPITAEELTRCGIAAVGCAVNAAEADWVAGQADAVLGLAGLGWF